MIRKRLGRVATVFMSAALLGAMALAASPVSAKGPADAGWILTITRLPAAVASGQDAGYRVFIKNPGPSNINGLSVKSLRTEAVSYFSGLSAYLDGPSSCSTSGQFSCSLGTLRAGQSITFTIAYTTSGTGTFDVKIELRSSSGDTGSDGGNSRGDAISVEAKTGLNSTDFNGGFYAANQLVETNQTLGSSNKQSTSLIGFNASATNRYDIMVGDGSTTLPPASDDAFPGLSCAGTVCSALKGQWSLLNVKEGQTQSAAFHAQVRVLASLFGNPDPATVNLVHVYLNSAGVSTTVVIGNDPGERCATPTTPATTEPGCIYVSTVGNGINRIFVIDAWLLHNGAIRGTW